MPRFIALATFHVFHVGNNIRCYPITSQNYSSGVPTQIVPVIYTFFLFGAGRYTKTVKKQRQIMNYNKIFIINTSLNNRSYSVFFKYK